MTIRNILWNVLLGLIGLACIALFFGVLLLGCVNPFSDIAPENLIEKQKEYQPSITTFLTEVEYYIVNCLDGSYLTSENSLSGAKAITTTKALSHIWVAWPCDIPYTFVLANQVKVLSGESNLSVTESTFIYGYPYQFWIIGSTDNSGRFTFMDAQTGFVATNRNGNVVLEKDLGLSCQKWSFENK